MSATKDDIGVISFYENLRKLIVKAQVEASAIITNGVVYVCELVYI